MLFITSAISLITSYSQPLQILTQYPSPHWINANLLHKPLSHPPELNWFSSHHYSYTTRFSSFLPLTYNIWYCSSYKSCHITHNTFLEGKIIIFLIALSSSFKSGKLSILRTDYCIQPFPLLLRNTVLFFSSYYLLNSLLSVGLILWL